MAKKKKKGNTSLFGVNVFDIYDKIKKVHKSIPNFDFDCKNCTENCCVSPYISIAEFIFVAHYIIRSYEEPHLILLRDNGRNKYGIEICPFLDNDKRCLIYPVRHYKCRMTGMDILDEIFSEVCLHKKEIGIQSPKIEKSEWLDWVNVLTKVNKPFQYDEQLKFEEWLKFYFEDDHKLTRNAVRARDFLRDYLHLETLIPKFTVEDIL